MGEGSNQHSESDSLPLLDWEIGHQRKRIPDALRDKIGAPTNWLRVPPDIHLKESQGKHLQFAVYYEHFSEFIETWLYVGKVPGEDKWRVIVYQTESRSRPVPYLIVIAKDKHGSFNFVSLHRRDESYVRRLILVGELELRED
jgi:hypothetical protein